MKSGSLGRWVDKQRTEYKALQQTEPSDMTPERIAALEAVPSWVWDAQEARWQEMYQRVLHEVVQCGRLPAEGREANRVMFMFPECKPSGFRTSARPMRPSSRARLCEAAG